MVRQRSTSDRRRRWVLILSAFFLALTFPRAYNEASCNKAFLVGAFLVPATQTGLALFHFDAIRSSPAAVRPIARLQPLSFLLALAMIHLTLLAGVLSAQWVFICWVFINWGWLFEMGLGLATPLRLPTTYAIFAVAVGAVLRAEEMELSVFDWAMRMVSGKMRCNVCCWAVVVIPIVLVLSLAGISMMIEDFKVFPADPRGDDEGEGSARAE